MGNPFERPKISKSELEKSKTQAYAEENLGQFENVEIKKVSELPCWHKINDFVSGKKIAGINNIDTIIANGGEQWGNIFGSNDSKSSHKPMMIILKKEIFDNENISDENASWLIHEIGHIQFYQDLGDNLDEYMEEYHRKGNYTDSDMEKFAFELQFEYLKNIGKTQEECVAVIENYLNKTFGTDKKEEKKSANKKLMKLLNNIK